MYGIWYHVFHTLGTTIENFKKLPFINILMYQLGAISDLLYEFNMKILDQYLYPKMCPHKHHCKINTFSVLLKIQN